MQGALGSGLVRRGCMGTVRSGVVWPGKSRLRKDALVEEWRGRVRRPLVSHGQARCALARMLRNAQVRSGEVRQGKPRFRWVSHGVVWRGKVRNFL